MEKKITGFVTGVGKSNRVSVDNTWYSMNAKCAQYLGRFNIGDKVHISLTGRIIDNNNNPIGEIGFIKIASTTETVEPPTRTGDGIDISTKPLGVQQKPANVPRPFLREDPDQKMRSMALSYSKDLELGWIAKADKPSTSHTESIIRTADVFYQYIKTGKLKVLE